MKWLEHIDLLPQHEIAPGMRGRFLHSDTMTFAFWEIDEGFQLSEHHHPNEQVAHMVEGTFALTVNGESKLLEAGAMTVISANVLHSGKAITQCRILDIFYPKREDYVFG